MAKRKRRRAPARGRADKVAESFGTALGGVAARVDSWLAQRAEIAADLRNLIGNAQGMLSSLGDAAILKIGRSTATSGTGAKTRKKRKPVSKEARAKIAEAQRRRRAARKSQPSAARKAKRARKRTSAQASD